MRRPLWRRVDGYVLRELLPPLLFGLLLYSGLAVISTTLVRLEWIVGSPVLPLLRWFAYQVPTAIGQTLPIARLYWARVSRFSRSVRSVIACSSSLRSAE